MGDLNCDLQSKDNGNVRALLNITDIYGLEQLINEPTRITPSTSTLIDLIFTNRPENVYRSGVSHVAISDHSLVYAYRKVSIPIKQLYDPNDMWRRWKELFLNVCEKHAPTKTKRTRDSKSPWITAILKKRMNFRDRLKRKAIKTKDPVIWDQFRIG